MKNVIDQLKINFKRIFSDRHFRLLFRYSLIIFFVILAGAIGVLLFEKRQYASEINNFFDALWWALVTITTVGYGDLVPITFWGRIIGIIFILLGFILFSIFTAFIASTFIDIRIKERKGLGKIKEKNHVLICGWNKSVHKILEFISNKKVEQQPTIVLVNELDENSISYLQNNYPTLQLKYVKGDFTNQEVLIRANVTAAKNIILLYDTSKQNASPSDERTIIAAHNIIYLNLKGKITLQLKDEKYLPNIRREKIHNVVIFDDIGGNILANSTLYPAVPDFVQELLKFKEGVGFRELDIPNEYVNKTYGDLFDYFKQKNYLLLGIVSEQTEFTISKILSDDSSSIDQFIKRQFELSRKKFKTEETKTHIKIKPNDDYVIQETDKAIVL